MKKITTSWIIPIALAFMIVSCNNNHDNRAVLKNEKWKIIKAINSVIGWAANKDTSLLYSVIAKDSNFLEVQPKNRIVKGINQFRESEPFFLSPDFKAIRYDIRDLKISISQSGTVAWFYCILDDINEWKGRPANWENTRWTGVLEKRDGTWRMVQQHFSFATE